MVQRPLGNTGVNVSPIAFGAFKVGRNEGIKYPSGYELPDDNAVEALLNGVLDLGINLIDTAPAYGLSEKRIGRAIARRRNEYLLATKVGETFERGKSTFDFSAAGVRASIDRSRSRLRTDQLDIVSIHSSGEDCTIINETDVVQTLIDLRDRSALRWIGFSGKTVEGAEAAMDFADVLMVEYHMNDRSHEPVIEKARATGRGVLVKKGLASGRLPPEEAVRFVLANPGVSALIIGSLNIENIRRNVHLSATIERTAE